MGASIVVWLRPDAWIGDRLDSEWLQEYEQEIRDNISSTI